MIDRPKLSLVLPVYNEDGIVKDNVKKLGYLVEKLNVSYEIIICDDHSTDGTQREVLSLSKEDPRTTYLRFNPRIGKGGTLKNAVRVAKGTAIMFMDADVPVSHQNLEKILGKLENGAKLVIGLRRSRSNTSVLRKTLSLAYNFLVRLLFRTGIMDHQCGLKVLATDFAKETLPKIRCDGFLFDTELIVRAKRMNVPIENIWVAWVENRPQNTSKIVPLRAILTLTADLAILRISQIMGKKLLTYKEVETGKFTNYKLNKTYEARSLVMDVKNQRLPEALKKIYLIAAFGKER